MEKIPAFSQVIQYLKEQEIICTIDHKNVSYYYLKNDRIHVNTPGAHYLVNLDEFKVLFHKETFYLYEPAEDTVDPLKDEEYYAWKSRGTN